MLPFLENWKSSAVPLSKMSIQIFDPKQIADGLKRPIVVSDRTKPTCGNDDCDIEENPTHWVDAELTREARRAILSVPGLVHCLSRMLAMPIIPNSISRARVINESAEAEASNLLKRFAEYEQELLGGSPVLKKPVSKQ